jgi:hypothetical protein
MRNVSAPCSVLPRKGDTNIRMQFDIDQHSPGGSRWLATGDTEGHLLLFDLLAPAVPAADEESGASSGGGPQEMVVPPLFKQRVAGEVLGGVALHPAFSSTLPLLATSSGQRHFFLKEDNGDDEQKEKHAKHAAEDALPLQQLAVWCLDHTAALPAEQQPAAAC